MSGTKDTIKSHKEHIKNDEKKIEIIDLNQFEVLPENSEMNSFIKENSREKLGNLKSLRKRVSVDFIIIFIISFISFLNFHFILFININDVNVLNKLEVLALSPEEYSIIANYLLESSLAKAKKCFAESNTFYENFLKNAWFWIDMTVYSIVPFISMSLASTYIAIKFKEINRKYSYLLMNKNYQLNKINYIKKMKKNRQICLMLLNANFYFLFIMTFYWICFLIFKISNDKSDLFNELQTFSYLFLFTHNAFQFLIYLASSSRYRRELYLTFFNFFKF